MTTLEQIKARLQPPHSVSMRTRAIFGLKGLNTSEAITALEQSLKTDPSALVRHEIAYVLGQMQASSAIPTLRDVLSNASEDVMVRHEAGEALGAIGDASVIPLLSQYANDVEEPLEIRETCTVALHRLHGLQRTDAGEKHSISAQTVYNSVDPAPPTEDTRDVNILRKTLCDCTQSLYERYRALFALRNDGGDEAVHALCDGMEQETDSALFRHEVAYVLGQMGSPASVAALTRVLRRGGESDMVRHEAAEALGAVGSPDAEAVLKEFRNDKIDAVRESVEIALDVSDYVNSNELHYAETIG